MTPSDPSKVSFLLKYTPRAASSRVRGVDLSLALERRGIACRLAHSGQRGYRVRYLRLGLGGGATVFQKRSSPNDHLLLRVRRRLGMASVYDLDDAPGGVPYDGAEEARAVAMMRDATAVTVGSRALLEFALRHHPHVELVPSAVDTDLFTPRPPSTSGLVTIGWMGNALAHLDDVLSLADVLARIRQQRRVRMVVVGAVGVRQVHEAFADRDDEVVDGLDWTDTSAIVRALSELDIGVYPLRSTLINKFTCAYKAIQYMAMGLPVVASPTGENRHVVRPNETGFLVETKDEWLDALTALVDDGALRGRMGAAGRAAALERFSTAVAAGRLLDVLRRARDAER